MNKIDDLLLSIAKQHLGIDILDVRNSDSLDFHDIGVSSLKQALHAAFAAGHEFGLNDREGEKLAPGENKIDPKKCLVDSEVVRKLASDMAIKLLTANPEFTLVQIVHEDPTYIDLNRVVGYKDQKLKCSGTYTELQVTIEMNSNGQLINWGHQLGINEEDTGWNEELPVPEVDIEAGARIIEAFQNSLNAIAGQPVLCQNDIKSGEINYPVVR